MSETLRVFDPLGFISPVTIRAKILLQRLWREDLDWDMPVSEELKNTYLAYYKQLPTWSVRVFNSKAI